MRKEYELVIVTNLPAFYKIRLFNEIIKHRSLLVVYTGHQSEGRDMDFFKGTAKFPFINLTGSDLNKCFNLLRILARTTYNELIVGSWDHPAMITALVFSEKNKNSLIAESSIYESTTTGIKGFIKRILCRRINKVYVPGKAQKRVFEVLKFKGEYRITHGVGIFNYQKQPAYIEKKDNVYKFLYVGRLTKVKNLPLLIEVFNELSDLELHIVGFGEQEQELKKIANKNIIFHGAVENEKLPGIYKSMDVFILPSKSEPWGLVIEEALNNGIPIIASDRVGCKDDLVTSDNGIIFDHTNQNSLKEAINQIRVLAYYNNLRKNISYLDFEKIEQLQVEAYL